MSKILYKKPFKLSSVFSNSELSGVALGKSISQHIELMIFTRFGEHRFDPNYGTAIWELEFELIVSVSTWEDKFRRSLLQSISNCEPRIYDVKADIYIDEVDMTFNELKNKQIKNRVSISLTAKIVRTGEPYLFKTHIFLSPLCG